MQASTGTRESSGGDPLGAICAFCGELFGEVSPLIDVLRHPVQGGASIAAHEHAGVVQLTWLRGCGGRSLADGEWVGVSGNTALVSYPGERHGYELRAMQEDAEVFLIKLPAPAGSVLQRARPLPHVATDLPSLPRLEDAIERLHRDVTPTRAAMPRWIADAAAVMTAWPRTASGAAAQLHEAHGPEADVAVAAAISLIEDRIGDPPSLEELARSAHLSARQFRRRFHQAIGVTPHEYITERRLARARILLFDDRLPGTAIAEALGFRSPGVFSRWFLKHEGRRPGEFRSDPTRF